MPSFPIDEIDLAIQSPQSEPKSLVSENLKVFLRIKPLESGAKVAVKSNPKIACPLNSAKKNNAQENRNLGNTKKNERVCITVNDSYSVTLSPPSALQELKRSNTEGKTGMLAAMGPSGSGKTHTVFGNLREPGMIPIALGQIFSRRDESSPGSSIFC